MKKSLVKNNVCDYTDGKVNTCIKEYDKSQKWIMNFNKITNQISNILLYLSDFNHWKCLQSKFYDAVTSGESSKIKLENKTFSKIVCRI